MFMSLLSIIICIGIAWLPLSDVTDTSSVINALIINVIYLDIIPMRNTCFYCWICILEGKGVQLYLVDNHDYLPQAVRNIFISIIGLNLF